MNSPVDPSHEPPRDPSLDPARDPSDPRLEGALEGGAPQEVIPIRATRIEGIDRLLERPFAGTVSRIVREGDHLRVLRAVGPVKARVTDSEGRPAGAVPVRVEVRRGDKVVAAREIVASASGYVIADFPDTVLDGETEVHLFPFVMEARKEEGQPAPPLSGTIVDLESLMNGDQTHVVVGRDPILGKRLDEFRKRLGRWQPPAMLDPADVANAPEMFAPSIIRKDGSCSLDYQSEIALSSRTFHQVVRLSDPGRPRTSKKVADIVPRLAHPYPRAMELPFAKPVRGSGPHGWEGLAGENPVQAWGAVPGLLNVYTQSWRRVGHGLGSLLYSLALAPCEQTNIAIIDWERRESARRSETITADEELSHELRRDRSIDEAVDSVLNEVQSGSSSTSQRTAGLSLGPIVLGGGGGTSRARSSGTRSLTMNTAQELADSTQQQGASMRSFRSTVVTSASAREREEITTRTVRNHNRNHALTVQYFQVVEHFVVETALSQQVDVLLVPYLVPGALWSDFPRLGTTAGSPNNAPGPAARTFDSNPLTDWIDRYGERLRRVFPPAHRKGLDALHRLMHTPEIYEAEDGGVSASRWTIEMEGGLTPGLRFRITTGGGGSYTLRPARAENGDSHFVATSSAIPLDSIQRLTVTFDADEAVREAVRRSTDRFGGGMENVAAAVIDAMRGFVEQAAEAAAHFRLDHVRLIAHTDPSRWLQSPRSVQVGEASPDNKRLSASDPSFAMTLSPPVLPLLKTAGARYRDYDRARRMARHLQTNGMAYLKHLWMAENPEERALRFDLYEYNGEPLLDLIENKPVGMIGNQVAFRLLDQGQLAQARTEGTVNFSRLVTLPTDGVFAETFLSQCNATELRDVNRMTDPSTGCSDQAPAITGITPGGRVGASIPSSMGLSAPVLNIQNAPGAPDPGGLAAAAQIMSQPDIFRDMSLGQATVEAVRTLSQQAMVTSGENQRAAIEALSKLLPMALGLPPAAGGGGAGVGQTVAGGAAQEAARAARTIAQGAVDQAHRAANPVIQRDHEQVIRQSDMSAEAKQRSLEALHNARTPGAEEGTSGGGATEPRPDGGSDRKLESRLVAELPGPGDPRRLVAQIFFKTREPGGDEVESQLASLDSTDRGVLERLRDLDWPHAETSTWEVHGFADVRGDRTGEEPALNVHLSRRRVEAVVGYLTDRFGPGPLFGEGIDWMLKAHGDQFSDPEDRDQFAYDRRVDIYVTVGAAETRTILPFTDDDIEQRLQRRLNALAERLASGEAIPQDMAWYAEYEIMLYAQAKEMLGLLQDGERVQEMGDPVLLELRRILNNQDTGALNLERMMVAIRRAGRPKQNTDIGITVGLIVWTVRDQERKARDPFYRIVYLSPLEGKHFKRPFFNLDGNPESHEDFPPAFEDLSNDHKQAAIDAGVRDIYLSGVEHRTGMRPHLDRRQQLVSEGKARLAPFGNLKREVDRNPSNWWLR